LTEVAASAPGRVNLLGEHTDYNEGFVLPIATPQRTTVHVAARGDRQVRVLSASLPPDQATAEYRLGEERRRGSWIDYVQGVTMALGVAGWPIGGFDGRIESEVPLGAGLSSSASLEVALVRALTLAFNLTLDEVETARVGHTAETAFVGVPVGIMDQMAASLATADAALFLDTRSLAFERIPLPRSAELVVINSGITHSHASGEYRIRRAECTEAARLLGVGALRDIDTARLAPMSLPPPLDRRVRHIVTENARVLAMRDALLAGDVAQAGALMSASHESMRDDYEVSTPEIDALVHAACEQPPVLGARLTGGGFGGCVVALVRTGQGQVTAEHIVAAYAERADRRATIMIPQPAGPARR
jgi:galactokinase